MSCGVICILAHYLLHAFVLFTYSCVQLAEQERLLAEKDHQASIQRIIEEERQKLLQEHASKLLGYLPKVCSPYTSFFVGA